MGSLTDSFIEPLTDWLTDWLINLLAGWLTDCRDAAT